MKKPTKKDNTVFDKKAEKMNQYLNELEEKFFSQVSTDEQDLVQIKQRGDHVQENYSAQKPAQQPPKEE